MPCADVAGLLKSIEEGNCVAFVGAGFSTAAELPDWGKLLWTLVHGLHAERVITEQEKAFLESRVPLGEGCSAAALRSETGGETG